MRETIMRIRNLLIAGCIAATASAPAFAGDGGASREENIGVGTGLVVGAAAAGPVGAVVGAAIGAKLGETFHKRNARIVALDGEIAGSRAAIARLEKEHDRVARDKQAISEDLRELRALARPELASLLQAGIEMDLLFRTDEHQLGTGTGDRLRDLATTIAALPDLRIRLAGYSDERGDEAYNRELSRKRAEHVRDVLTAGGVDAARIELIAHGESPARDQTPDSYALERKVNLTLYVDGAASFASTPAQ